MWKDLWDKHRGTCVGTACGIGLGIIYLIAGLWDMLIFAFIVYIGYTIGKRTDQDEPLPGADQIWRWLTDRWRMFR